MSQDFEIYRLKSRQVQAVRYALDASNAKILTQHTLIQGRQDNLDLTLVNDDATVSPGDWIVKVDGDFHAYSDEEFHRCFEEVRAGIACIFCGERLPNVEKLKEHSADCPQHPANKKTETT